MATSLEAKRFYVSGNVQGVGYRFFAQRAAGKLGIRGFVRNLFDGRVEVYAIGSGEQLSALRTELRRGPTGATVEEVSEDTAEMLDKYASDFFIEHEN